MSTFPRMGNDISFTILQQQERYYPYQLSWLAFNERVLQEAADENNPIVERIRFLGIFSNNMDEFFRVRVAEVKREIIIHTDEGNEEAAEKTRALLEQIQDKVVQMTEQFDRLCTEVINGLAKRNIHIVDKDNLTEFQRNWLLTYFREEVLRYIAPILLQKGVNLVERLNGTSTYLMAGIYREEKKKVRYAVIEVPTERMSRFVLIPPEKSRKKKHIILLDDLIQLGLDIIFRGFLPFDRLDAYSFKLTRDSEYAINDEIDESYVDKMSESMKQRLVAEPVRIIYDGDMPEHMLDELKKRLKLTNLDSLLAGGAYRNFRDFISFPNVGRDYLEYPKLPPLTDNDFARFNTAFDAIKHSDILLYYPYHKFLHFTEFVRQAAFDTRVKHIRLNIYRVARKSRIISSLIDAVDNGKAVTVVVELRARFDEEANIEWSRQMRDAGIRVLLGVPSLKVHAKLCVVTREENGKLVNYTHFGTGNFNEKTAEIYTDFSLFTCHEELGKEAVTVFDMLQNPLASRHYNLLQVSPLNARSSIIKLIQNEIAFAGQGQLAQITLKLNNLVDAEIIDELYKASQAGVIIRAIIRGMCSLKPGVKGLSENIQIISIVDRFLEHPRVLLFENGGDQRMYISSADWMMRNMDNRVEVGCPILDKKLIGRITRILDIQFEDTLKSRVIDKNQSNEYVRRGNRRKLRSQMQIYDFLKGLEKKKLKEFKENTEEEE
jgi:polyphosphate kinase